MLICGIKGCTWGLNSPLPLTLEGLATLATHLMEHIEQLEGLKDASVVSIGEPIDIHAKGEYR